MKRLAYDVVIIGGGPAGMAAACKAAETVRNVLIIERNDSLGGVLNQCIHTGFGLQYFGENLTGPEFADRQKEQVQGLRIDVALNTFVMKVLPTLEITAVNREGVMLISAAAIVLAMGCRERTRESIVLPGARVAGVYTAGTAQRYTNIENLVPGNQFVILGSGDIGLIMARRLTLEGLEVKGVYEIMPEPNGLQRNIKNCLDDFHIPLHLSATITKIIGKERVQAVEVSEVDEHLNPIPGTENIVTCDTVLLAVGLIPENELTLGAGAALNQATNGPLVNDRCQTTIPGMFACGNVLHVHDLVDHVVAEAEKAGEQAAAYVSGWQTVNAACILKVQWEEPIRYTVPDEIHDADKAVLLSFRVKKGIHKGRVIVRSGTQILWTGKVKNYKPSIMEQLVIPSEVLEQAADTITVAIRQEETE